MLLINTLPAEGGDETGTWVTLTVWCYSASSSSTAQQQQHQQQSMKETDASSHVLHNDVIVHASLISIVRPPSELRVVNCIMARLFWGPNWHQWTAGDAHYSVTHVIWYLKRVTKKTFRNRSFSPILGLLASFASQNGQKIKTINVNQRCHAVNLRAKLFWINTMFMEKKFNGLFKSPYFISNQPV